MPLLFCARVCGHHYRTCRFNVGGHPALLRMHYLSPSCTATVHRTGAYTTVFSCDAFCLCFRGRLLRMPTHRASASLDLYHALAAHARSWLLGALYGCVADDSTASILSRDSFAPRSHYRTFTIFPALPPTRASSADPVTLKTRSLITGYAFVHWSLLRVEHGSFCTGENALILSLYITHLALPVSRTAGWQLHCSAYSSRTTHWPHCFTGLAFPRSAEPISTARTT